MGELLSAESASPKRAVRKGCYIRDIEKMRSEGPTPINLTNPIHTFHPTLYRRLSEIHETPPQIL